MSAPLGEPSTTAPSTEQPPAGAPQQQTVEPTQTEPTPKPQEAPEAAPVKTFDEAYVTQLRSEAAKHRTEKAETARERDQLKQLVDSFRKALDPNSAPDEDPKVVAERAIAERDARASELAELRVERAAERAARSAGADVDALLDSRGFAAALKKLDPTAETFDADVKAAVEKALETNPRLKATTATTSAPRSATDTKSGSTPPGQISREQLKSMSPEDIVKAKNDGRLKAILGG